MCCVHVSDGSPAAQRPLQTGEHSTEPPGGCVSICLLSGFKNGVLDSGEGVALMTQLVTKLPGQSVVCCSLMSHFQIASEWCLVLMEKPTNHAELYSLH